jgi:sulfate adenylyltransferase subunit 2
VVERSGQLVMVDDDRLPLGPGEAPRVETIRFRTLGCYPLTAAVRSGAATVEGVVDELREARSTERQGRLIDHDQPASMEKKKREGYF